MNPHGGKRTMHAEHLAAMGLLVAITGTACMTRREMYGSGAGIGMRAIPQLRRPIRAVLYRARTGCSGAAIGTAS
jgi:hypothetical protein